MITHINDLQSPFFGQKRERNAAIEYEEDGETSIRIFFSQNQGLEILDGFADASLTCAEEDYQGRILRCGLPVSSAQEPVTIRGNVARLLRRAREALTQSRDGFASDSRERILIFLQTFEDAKTVCILFVIDQTTARHIYIIHGMNEARSVLEELRDVGPPGSHASRLEQIECSELAERSAEPTLHIEHDAASYLGMRIEFFWMRLMTHSSKVLSP